MKSATSMEYMPAVYSSGKAESLVFFLELKTFLKEIITPRGHCLNFPI